MPAVGMVKSSVGGCLFFPVEKDFENFAGGYLSLLDFRNLPLSNDLIRYSWGPGNLYSPVDGGPEGKTPASSANSVISERGPKTNPKARWQLVYMVCVF